MGPVSANDELRNLPTAFGARSLNNLTIHFDVLLYFYAFRL